jgi:hypothetical protein
MSKRIVIGIVTGTVVLLAATGAIALSRTMDTMRTPVPGEIGALDAGSMSGELIQVDGIIRGVNADNIDRTKAFEIETTDGRTLRVVLNGTSDVTAPSAPRLPLQVAASDELLPFEVMGYRFVGTARTARLGPLGLQRWLVVNQGIIEHP